MENTRLSNLVEREIKLTKLYIGYKSLLLCMLLIVVLLFFEFVIELTRRKDAKYFRMKIYEK